MELCKNGCNDVWNSKELVEVIDLLISAHNITVTNKELKDTNYTLYNRIESKVRNKLRRKEHDHDT